MKILLFVGVLIYFGSRWVLSRGKKNNQEGKKPFFSYVLLLAEICAITVIVTQLLWDVVKWDLPVVAQIFGFTLFIVGVFLSVYSRTTLNGLWSTARDFSKPEYLIQDGPYRYIRHPIYCGTLLMGLGFELAVASHLFWVVLTAGTLVIYLCSVKEEKKLVHWFPEYADYQKRTKKFIPFVF